MNLSDKLNLLLQEAVDRREVAGISVLVLKNGRERAWAQAGFADIAAGKPFQRDNICRLYSMTKPVTAVAAMLLVEQGKLDLGASVGSILPAFQNMQVWEQGKKVPARRNILVKDLLNMTSGLSYPGTDESGQEVARIFEDVNARLRGPDALTTRQIADRIGGCGLAFHPGDQWMYGTSADVLGAVIQEVAGCTLADWMHQKIFLPLGMEDTGFWVPDEKRHRLAKIYRCGSTEPEETNNLGICCDDWCCPNFQSGGAGLVGTIDDYAKLAQSLLGHGRQILKRSTIAYMTAGRLLPWQQESAWRSWESMAGYGYSNLMRILEEPGMALLTGRKGEYGWDGWLGTYFCNCPEEDMTVLLFCQRIDAGTMEITRKVRNVIAADE